MANLIYTPADRRIPTEILRLKESLNDVQSPTGTERERTLLKLQQQVDSIQLVVNEQQAQSTHFFQAAPLDVSAGTPGVFPTFTRALSFPAPQGGSRIATLGLSAEFERTSPSGNITIWLEILQDGVSTWKRSGAFFVGDTASAPAAWGNPSINEPIQLVVANAAQAAPVLRLYTHTFVSGVVTAQMKNIQATLTYGPRTN